MTASKSYVAVTHARLNNARQFVDAYTVSQAEPGFEIQSIEVENFSRNRVLISFATVGDQSIESSWDAMVSPYRRRVVNLPSPQMGVTVASWAWYYDGQPSYGNEQILYRVYDAPQAPADAPLGSGDMIDTPPGSAGLGVSAVQSGSWSVNQAAGSSFSVIQQSGDVWSVGGAGGGPISISGTITATQGGTWSVAQATGSTFQVIQQSGSVFAVSGSGNFQIINSPGAVINAGAPKTYIGTMNPAAAGVNNFTVTLDPTYTALTVFTANASVTRIRKINGVNGWPDWDFNPFPTGQTVIVPLTSGRETTCTIEVTNNAAGPFIEINALRGPIAVVPLNYGNQNVQVTALPGNSLATTGTFFQAGAAWSAVQNVGGTFTANAVKQLAYSIYVFVTGITSATPTQGRSCQVLLGIKTATVTAYLKSLLLAVVPDANGVGVTTFNETVLDPFPQGMAALLGATTGLQFFYIYNTNLLAPAIVMGASVVQ